MLVGWVGLEVNRKVEVEGEWADGVIGRVAGGEVGKVGELG